MKKAKFRHLKFSSQKEFDAWLDKTTDKVIYLNPEAGDMSQINIHNSGEILHCDFHSVLYNGRFIDVDNLKVGFPIRIWDNDKIAWIEYVELIIEKITKL